MRLTSKSTAKAQKASMTQSCPKKIPRSSGISRIFFATPLFLCLLAAGLGVPAALALACIPRGKALT
jgi:hypothetical protein